tara:strand:+ start:9148 stop:10443 length:1296 start_codon:yes stop_codon:yes gene_type:complete
MTTKMTVNINELKQSLEKTEVVEVAVDPFKEKRKELGDVSKASNDASTKQNFNGRKSFKELFNKHKEVTIDTWYEQSYYGKVDVKGNLIVPKDSMINIGTQKKPIYVLQFVAAAFANFQTSYKRKKINKTKSQHLLEVRAAKGMTDLKPYDSYIEQFYVEFFSSTLQNMTESRRLRTLSDFYDELLGYVRFSGKPFTFPSFIESAQSSEYNSGLIIDVKDWAVDVDKKKVEFYDDPNYVVYEQVAKVNGFKIDPNIPWRLIADVRSSFMKHPVEHSDVSSVYNVNFNKAANYDLALQSFVEKLESIYRRFIEEHTYYFFETIEDDNPTLNKVERPKFIDDQTSRVEYIKWYIDLRITESSVFVPERVIESLTTTAKQLYWLSLRNPDPLKTNLRNKLTHHVEYTIGTPLFRKDSQLTGGTKGAIFLNRAIE